MQFTIHRAALDRNSLYIELLLNKEKGLRREWDPESKEESQICDRRWYSGSFLSGPDAAPVCSGLLAFCSSCSLHLISYTGHLCTFDYISRGKKAIICL